MAKKSTKKQAVSEVPNYSRKQRIVARFRRPSDMSPKPRLSAAWQLSKLTAETLRKNWQLLSGITLIYALLTILLVGGYSLTTNNAVKTTLHSGTDRPSATLAALLELFGSNGSGSDPGAGVYQFMLTLIAGLAIVWALRQIWAGTARIRIRDAFYQGMYPLIPVILVLLTICLQLVPFLLGSVIYMAVISKSIATTPTEHIIIGLLCLLLAIASVYMVLSSLFALYIAALPDMTPMRALRSARELVRYRRLSILRKLLFLPLVMLLGTCIIMIPVLLLLTPLAAAVFILLTMIGLPIIHTYLYTLYRELLI